MKLSYSCVLFSYALCVTRRSNRYRNDILAASTANFIHGYVRGFRVCSNVFSSFIVAEPFRSHIRSILRKIKWGRIISEEQRRLWLNERFSWER
ncbi:MAG: hypothetical protein ACLGG7_10250 [Bacteriovoracia bacterium]